MGPRPELSNVRHVVFPMCRDSSWVKFIQKNPKTGFPHGSSILRSVQVSLTSGWEGVMMINRLRFMILRNGPCIQGFGPPFFIDERRVHPRARVEEQ